MSIFESVIVYLVTIISTSYAFDISSKLERSALKNIVLSFAFAIPVIVAGLRYGIGEDYFTYINGFEIIKEGTAVRWDSIEKGYVFLNLFLAELEFPAQSIMFVTSFMTIWFVSMALLNKSKTISVGFGILTFMVMFYQGSFNIIRMMIAVSIFFYNLKNIENHNLFKYSLFTVLEASFHASALATFPLYWLYNRFLVKTSILRAILIYIIALFLIINFNQILDWILLEFSFTEVNYYKQYIGNSDKTADIAFKKTIMYLPILLPGIFMYKKLEKYNKYFHIYYSLTVIGVIIKAAATFNVAYVDRISLYFLIASIMLVSTYMSVLKKSKNYLLYFAIIIYLFSYWIYVYVLINDHGTFPYEWIL